MKKMMFVLCYQINKRSQLKRVLLLGVQSKFLTCATAENKSFLRGKNVEKMRNK